MRLSRATRINMEYGDVNAAGSYFAMLLCLAAGLALVDHARARGSVAIAGALVIGLALWLTSSRAAILAVLVVGALSAALSFARPRAGVAADLAEPRAAAVDPASAQVARPRWPGRPRRPDGRRADGASCSCPIA